MRKGRSEGAALTDSRSGRPPLGGGRAEAVKHKEQNNMFIRNYVESFRELHLVWQDYAT